MKKFLFLSGEFRVTLPLIMKKNNWVHTMNSKRLEIHNDGTFGREGFFESFHGLIYYASVSSSEIRKYNLNLIIENKIPCWPDPKILLKLDDRHEVMKQCIENKLVNHNVIQCKQSEISNFPISPFVIKVGNKHCGDGKYLINDLKNIIGWDGIATIEPYFEGQSIRILFIDDKYFAIKYENNESWIKNSPGCEVTLLNEIPKLCLEHAKLVKNLFNLEVCGIDYIIKKNDNHYFLEYNQFPGLDVDDSLLLFINSFFMNKMLQVERI